MQLAPGWPVMPKARLEFERTEAAGALEKFFAKFHTLKRWMRQHAETYATR
jgi:hypothetical protein